MRENLARIEEVLLKIQKRYKKLLIFFGLDASDPITCAEIFGIINNFRYNFSEIAEKLAEEKEKQYVHFVAPRLFPRCSHF